MPSMTESDVEAAALDWLAELGYPALPGPDIAPGEALAERASYGDMALVGRLRAALGRLNPEAPAEAVETHGWKHGAAGTSDCSMLLSST